MILPIRLDQFLKIVGAAETGGQAKHLITEGYVMVNSETESRRGRKLVAGDEVELDGLVYVVPGGDTSRQ